MGAGGDGFVSIDSSGADDADGWFLGFHDSCLYGGGVGAEEHFDAVEHVECVLHVAGWVVGRGVHSGEVVPIVFYFGSVGNGETDALEYVHDAVHDDGDGVSGAEWDGFPGGCEVYAF